jgi:hypothetical protein
VPVIVRAYFDRKKAAGKPSNEAMRALKRRLSDIVYRTLRRPRDHQHGDGPGRTLGNVTSLQRDRLAFPRRLFGSVTSRTIGKDGVRLGDLWSGFPLDSAPAGMDALSVICRPQVVEASQRRRAGQT